MGVTRVLLLSVVALGGCAGGDQNQPGGATLGSSAGASSTGDTDPTGAASTGSSGASGGSSSADVSTSDASATSGAESSGGGDESSSDSSGGGAVTWHRYTRDMIANTWIRTPLDELWTGPNAPPASGIAAAVSLTHFDRFIVLSDDGMIYERVNRVWQTPEPLAERFPAAVGYDITAMVHTPGQDGTTDSEDLFLIETPVAVVYTQFENGGLELAQVADLMDHDGGAPQGSVANEWALAISDPSGIGNDPDWLRWYSAYANGELWEFNAAFEWTLFPIGDNPFFSGAAGEPDPTTVQAAYYDDAFERAHFIAP